MNNKLINYTKKNIFLSIISFTEKQNILEFFLSLSVGSVSPIKIKRIRNTEQIISHKIDPQISFLFNIMYVYYVLYIHVQLNLYIYLLQEK